MRLNQEISIMVRSVVRETGGNAARFSNNPGPSLL